MKSGVLNLIIFVLSCWSLFVKAQVVKTNIVEHFTNTSCSVCASRNPAIHNAINANPGTLHISFHPSVPYTSDFFNKQNKQENDGRTIFYDVLYGTPVVVLNGRDINDSQLTSLLSQPSMTNHSIKVKQTQISSDSFVVSVVIIKEAADINNQVLLFAGVMEDTIEQLTNNGENFHYNVFRKALSNVTGDTIELPSVIGDSMVYNFNYAAKVMWEVKNLHTIAILQQFDRLVINSAISINVDPITTSSSDLNDDKHPSFLYPNPFDSVLKSKVDLNDVKLFNFSGQLLYTIGNIKKDDEMELTMLPLGSYLISGLQGNKIITQTVIKK